MLTAFKNKQKVGKLFRKSLNFLPVQGLLTKLNGRHVTIFSVMTQKALQSADNKSNEKSRVVGLSRTISWLCMKRTMTYISNDELI